VTCNFAEHGRRLQTLLGNEARLVSIPDCAHSDLFCDPRCLAICASAHSSIFFGNDSGQLPNQYNLETNRRESMSSTDGEEYETLDFSVNSPGWQESVNSYSSDEGGSSQ
jgi:hypothetical protein